MAAVFADRPRQDAEITRRLFGTRVAVHVGMGRRRRDVRKAKVYLISRRCTRRYHLFTPDPAGIVAALFWYALGYAALLAGVQVCGAILMSSHYHLVIVDRRGELPKFLETMDRMLACSTKAFRGWPEEVFNKSQASAVELVSVEAIIEKLAYTKANGVTSFAVRNGDDWPGAKTRVADLGQRVIRADHHGYWLRPPGRNDGDGDEVWVATEDDPPVVGGGWPHAVELAIELPEALLEQLDEEEARRRIRDEQRRQERDARREAKETGYSFPGRDRVLRQKHTRRARSWETFGSRNPRFAAGGDLDAARAAIERFREFDRQYDEALAKWRSGDRRRSVFPHGTWKMRVVHNARCRPP